MERSGFISYAHDDLREFKIIAGHLKQLRRNFGFDFWSDDRNRAGAEITPSIMAAIARSTAIVLLLSPAFFESDYIFDHELPAINRQRAAAGSLVIPVLLRRCSWQAFVNGLVTVPLGTDGRPNPVIEWSPEDHGFDAVRQQIEIAICSVFQLKPITRL